MNWTVPASQQLTEENKGAHFLNPISRPFLHRRRTKTEEQVKVVASVLGGRNIQFLDALAVFTIERFWRIGRIHPFLSNHPGASHPITQNRPRKKTTCSARNWISYFLLSLSIFHAFYVCTVYTLYSTVYLHICSLSLHICRWAMPSVKFHCQQWITSANRIITYNLFEYRGKLCIFLHIF